jgi:hypothetical protein
VGALTIVDAARTALRRDWEEQEIHKQLSVKRGKVIGAAGVVLGSSASAVVLRAAWTTFNLVARWPFPYRLHRDLDTAAAWLAPLLARVTSEPASSSDILRACRDLDRADAPGVAPA